MILAITIGDGWLPEVAASHPCSNDDDNAYHEDSYTHYHDDDVDTGLLQLPPKADKLASCQEHLLDQDDFRHL
eukprot:4706382-Amphidinium_carterae.1